MCYLVLLLPAELHLPLEVTSAFFKIILNSDSVLLLAITPKLMPPVNLINIQPARQNRKQVKIWNGGIQTLLQILSQ